MDDSGSRLPEANAVTLGHRGEEVIDLFVAVDSGEQVGAGTAASLDQVIAVDRGRNSHSIAPRHHELQQGHLCGRVLHGDPIGPEHQEVDTSLPANISRVVEVRDQDLLGQSHGTAELGPACLQLLAEVLVHSLDDIKILHLSLRSSSSSSRTHEGGALYRRNPRRGPAPEAGG